MDREKVIKGLEYCVSSNDCRPCEYWMEFDNAGCQIMKDALALLKEQKAKAGKWIPVTNGRGGMECSICHEYAPSYQNGAEYLSKYCPSCGAKLEGR